jgi:hypothetical protein
MQRRALISGSIGTVVAGAAAGSMPAVAAVSSAKRRMVSVEEFGAVGDGMSDDTHALQAALDATFSATGSSFLLIPPGTYKVTQPLRVTLGGKTAADITRRSGIVAHGARLASTIANGDSVVEFISHSTVRFMLIEGLEILGTGHEGHGIALQCDHQDKYLYNFCLRDVVVQGCGGDGCRLTGNVFEGQIINSYFRGNHGNGATFAHSKHGGILSALHVFACIFGENGRHGAALIENCYDVSFHGCYFLLNGNFGLAAENGCTLLSNCGFENNHASAQGFESGDAGIYLNSFGTLVGCTAYSMFNQTKLLRAYLTGQLSMTGCVGQGGGQAKNASLATIGGRRPGNATLIGCSGRVEYRDGFDGIELAGDAGGIRLPAHWASANLPQLGDYRLWIDHSGRLRLKKGAPTFDEDGAIVGS